MKYDIWTVTTDINPVTVIDHLFIQLSWHVNIGVAQYYTILVLSFLKGMSYDAFLAILDSAVVVCFCLVVFGWRNFRALYKNTPWVTSRESECIENWADTIQLQVVVLESDRSDQFQTMAQHSRDLQRQWKPWWKWRLWYRRPLGCVLSTSVRFYFHLAHQPRQSLGRWVVGHCWTAMFALWFIETPPIP